MKLSEEIKEEVDGINQKRSLSLLKIIKKIISAYSNILPKIEQLEKENEQLKNQIEKMKCCYNCVVSNCKLSSKINYTKCDKWELYK
jgi:CRISPR/Cas system CMR-associated protein Cmr5 small subunit